MADLLALNKWHDTDTITRAVHGYHATAEQYKQVAASLSVLMNAAESFSRWQCMDARLRYTADKRVDQSHLSEMLRGFNVTGSGMDLRCARTAMTEVNNYSTWRRPKAGHAGMICNDLDSLLRAVSWDWDLAWQQDCRVRFRTTAARDRAMSRLRADLALAALQNMARG